MKLHYTIDDSAARLPLAIRSDEGLWDRAADLRSAPGVQLVELTTQHMAGTSTTLVDELAHYFEHEHASENDPYHLAECYENRALLEDLLRDVRDLGPHLVALDEIEALFPASFRREINVTLALTVVGYPAFGYVRTYKDSEGDEYHGMVVNLTQARPHLEERLGTFSLSLLADMIRYGFFNHQMFLITYEEYCEAIDRVVAKPADRLKDALMRNGIAWYLSYRHDLIEHADALGLDTSDLDIQAAQWNAAIQSARGSDSELALAGDEIDVTAGERFIGLLGYTAATAIAERHGMRGLHDSIVQGADHFMALYDELGGVPLAQ